MPSKKKEKEIDSSVYICIYTLWGRERERKYNDASENEPHMVRHVAQITRMTTVLPLSVVVSSSFKLLFSKLFEWTKLHGIYTQFCYIISFLVERESKINYPG